MLLRYDAEALRPQTRAGPLEAQRASGPIPAWAGRLGTTWKRGGRRFDVGGAGRTRRGVRILAGDRARDARADAALVRGTVTDEQRRGGSDRLSGGRSAEGTHGRTSPGRARARDDSAGRRTRGRRERRARRSAPTRGAGRPVDGACAATPTAGTLVEGWTGLGGHSPPDGTAGPGGRLAEMTGASSGGVHVLERWGRHVSALRGVPKPRRGRIAVDVTPLVDARSIGRGHWTCGSASAEDLGGPTRGPCAMRSCAGAGARASTSATSRSREPSTTRRPGPSACRPCSSSSVPPGN